MQQIQHSLLAIIILTLVVTACQQTSRDDSLSTTEEAITSTEMVTLPFSTPMSTKIPTPLPTPTNLPMLTPTNTLIPSPTPTAIPVDAPSPTATSTPAPLPSKALLPSKVDLPTLNESLAMLDRVERRAEPTSTSVPVIIYEGRASSFVSKPSGGCYCLTCANDKFSAEATISADGNVWGVFSYEAYQKPVIEFADDKVKVQFTGTQDSITGRQEFHANGDYVIRLCTGTLNAILINDGERFEGTIEETCAQDANYHWCGGVWTFALPRK
jgi:hypothetical protein